MSDIICVTDRNTCCEDFLTRIERIAEQNPKAIILRAKELTCEEYTVLAEKVIEICGKYGTECILHNFTNAALSLGYPKIHLQFHKVTGIPEEIKSRFSVLGASCHHWCEAQSAQKAGATYITAGHIFATDCKKGLPPRGLDFLREVCRAINVPVYAIGGISRERMPQVLEAGAAGGCIMSGLMSCPPEKIREILDMQGG